MAAFTFTFTPTHASWLNRGLLFQAGALDAPAYPRRPRNTNSRSAYWPLSTTSIVNRSSTVGATKSTMRPDRIGPLYWKHRTSPSDDPARRDRTHPRKLSRATCYRPRRSLQARGRLNAASVIRFARLLYASLDAFLRRLIATAADPVTGCSFFFRPPATGRSNDRWRRSAGPARFFLAAVPLIAGVSCARLRFRAAIRSIAGGGVTTSWSLMGRPFSLASISARSAS